MMRTLGMALPQSHAGRTSQPELRMTARLFGLLQRQNANRIVSPLKFPLSRLGRRRRGSKRFSLH